MGKRLLAKDIEDFDFTDTPINEALIRELANGTFIADQRNAVLIGGAGTGKSHLAIAIARALIRNGARGRFFNVVDLVNRLRTSGQLLFHLISRLYHSPKARLVVTMTARYRSGSVA
ncbi:IstB ATP binding domain-containing protein [Mesorhizobium amorphae CCNWGS0123]|uniref:IstB ATP binding domain-containing protein n=1 Tax=Mesorhizobium amorphae CCNWGS0123 TaxID=1082933 RepID=G6Y6C0_9HYPH|nr:IstB ATP binding domain-containing protein [Mesorhizobium amorphae CCNWGS0123]